MAVLLHGAVVPAPQLFASQHKGRMLGPFRVLYNNNNQSLGGAIGKRRLLQQQQPGSVCRWDRRDNQRGASQQCKSSMSFNNNGSTAEGFSERDEDYVDSSIIEAVEVKSGSDGFLIKMRDGRFVKCVHNNPDGGHLPDYAPQPAIVLKMEDGSDLLLPIIVLELPSTMLMEAVRQVQVARPTVYQVMRDMLELMGYQAKLVRVTRRVHEAYYARVYLSKIDDGSQKMVSLDLRPSDAINLAVRCKIPIQVNRELAYGDGVRIVTDSEKVPIRSARTTVGVVLTELDRPQSDTCAAAEEFVLVRSMMMAAIEERYSDAARLRDELSQLRIKKRRQQKQI
jgi:bifunctional DNase/RNase